MRSFPSPRRRRRTVSYTHLHVQGFHNADFRIFAEIIQGEAIPVGGNDAGNREEKGPEKDKEVFYNAQSDYLAGEGKAVKQREKLRTLPLAHCHTCLLYTSRCV